MLLRETIEWDLCITVGKVERSFPIVMEQEPKDNPSPEDDPALEREYQELAQWLIDVYLWKREEERKEDKNNKGPAR